MGLKKIMLKPILEYHNDWKNKPDPDFQFNTVLRRKSRARVMPGATVSCLSACRKKLRSPFLAD